MLVHHLWTKMFLPEFWRWLHLQTSRRSTLSEGRSRFGLTSYIARRRVCRSAQAAREGRQNTARLNESASPSRPHRSEENVSPCGASHPFDLHPLSFFSSRLWFQMQFCKELSVACRRI